MPNHFHLLLAQKAENGTVHFMRKLNGGYAKYFNIKYKRTGTLFEGRYKRYLFRGSEIMISDVIIYMKRLSKKIFKVFSKVFFKLAIFLLIAILGFSNAAPAFFNKFGAEKLAENLKVKEAQAATYQMQTGYFIGNGSAKSIKGLGFSPQMVVLKSDTTAIAAVFKTISMPNNTTAYLGSATADSAAGFITLDSDGFTVASTANTANVRYTWIAFAGSDCTATGVFCVGSYQGTGAAKSVTTGFQPDLVWVKNTTTGAPNWRSSSMATNVGQYFAATTQDTTGVLFTTLDATGFSVGATNSASAVTYYYAAFKSVAGSVNVGTYSGNATDNRNIAGVGFVPDWVFLKNANAATAVAAVYNVKESYGDYSSYYSATANLVDSIQALQTDGFQVGTNSTSNGSGNTIYYAAFTGSTAHTSSGTFQMAVGSYTGTAAVLNVENIGFVPDLVIIKGNTAQAGVFRTRMMAGNVTAYLDSVTADFSGGITSLNPNGFTVGTSTVVNTSAVAYYWTAYGNAWNPDTNSGASDFAIGAYYGNGIDNRNITRIPFQPNLVVIKRSGANGGVFRTSAQTGDISSYFAATADVANLIQTLNTDGFQVGTAANVNTAANNNWFFVFKSGTNFTVNSYSGTGSSQNITTVGFQPDNIWVKRTTAVQGVSRKSSLAGDGALPFIAAASVANAITGIIATGFTVNTATETNASGGSYWYAAWKATVGIIIPDATSVTYTVSPDGGRSGESITITGTNFGSVLDGNQDNCLGGSGTGCVRFIVGGSATVADTDVTAWSGTSITFTISVSLASYGGAAALQVVAASQSDITPLTFYVYPTVSSISVPTGFPADAAREYDAGDSDGLITLNGNHFGTASSTGYVRILGCDSTTCASPAGSVEIQTGTTCDSGDSSPGDGWSETCIRVRVPPVIADNAYTGNIAMQQGTGGNSKTHTFGNTFRVLPRIVSNTPTSDIVGNRVKIAGNHFCQGAGCPVSPNRSTAADNVKFGSTQAADGEFVNSGASPCSGNAQAWTDAEICVKVPAGTPAGSASTTITSNTSYTSNAKTFTVQSSVPNDPDLGPGTDKGQYKSDGSTVIGVGSSTNQTTVVFKMLMSVGPNATLEPQVEIAYTSSSTFTNTPTATGTAVSYTGTAVTGTVTSASITDNTYHWQARVRNVGTGEYSNWKSFPTNPGEENAETATDFKVDTTVPNISFGSPDTCDTADGIPGTNNATIAFSTNETADSGEIEYSTSSTFASGNQTQTNTADQTSYSFSLANLNSNTTYYWRVKATDLVGNSACRSNGSSGATCPAPSPFCSFLTQSVNNKPAKTATFYAFATSSVISAGSTASSTFIVYMPEQSTSTISAFVELTGLSLAVGTNNVQIWVNSQAAKTYAINSNKTFFRIIYKIDGGNLNIDPSTNAVYVNPSLDTYIISSRVKVTYSYTP